MTTTNLDQIGTEAARLLASNEDNVKAAAPLLRQIWAAFDDAKKNKVEFAINGAKSKTEWAAQAKVSMRMCQYVVKDGSRKRYEKDANRVRPMALLKELIMVVSTGSPKMVIDKASAICEQINWTPPDWKNEEKESRTKQPKSPVVTEMEKTLDSTKPIIVPGENKEAQCDYGEDEVATMFATGGK